MAALTLQATRNNDQSHDVVKSTDDAIGSAEAAVIFDDTKTKDEIMSALRACLRAVSREMGKVSTPDDFATSGTTVE